MKEGGKKTREKRGGNKPRTAEMQNSNIKIKKLFRYCAQERGRIKRGNGEKASAPRAWVEEGGKNQKGGKGYISRKPGNHCVNKSLVRKGKGEL